MVLRSLSACSACCVFVLGASLGLGACSPPMQPPSNSDASSDRGAADDATSDAAMADSASADGAANDATVDARDDSASAPSAVVSAISPSSASNSRPTTVTITGSGFVEGSTVSIGGRNCTDVRVDSSTQIQCTSPVAAMVCGAQDVAVMVPGASAAAVLRGGFQWMPEGVTFASPVDYAVGRGSVQLVAADMDRDGRLDILSANRDSNNVTLSRGQADGTLSGSPSVVSADLAPSAVAAADVNGDGALDVVASYTTATGTIRVTLNGPGGLDPSMSRAISLQPAPFQEASSIALGDLDGDRKLDLVVGSRSTLHVAIFQGDGLGGFTYRTTRAVGGSVADLALADITRDGMLDIVTANSSTNSMTVSTNMGMFMFSNPANTSSVGDAPSALAVRDLDGDGFQDFVVASQTWVSVYFGTASNIPANPRTTMYGLVAPSQLALGDLNRDGFADLVFSSSRNSAINVLYSDRAPNSFLPVESYPTGPATAGLAVADLDGDGLLDLVGGNSAANTITVRRQVCR